MSESLAASQPDQKHPVFVLEDDARIRSRFSKLLEASGGFSLTGAAASLSDACKKQAEARKAEILLVDLRLPDGNGTSFIAEAAAWSPRPRIAVISALGDERSVVSAMEAGADGYVLKDLRPNELIPMLESLLRGEAPISPAIARYLLKHFRHDETASGEVKLALSAKEQEVLSLVAKGFTYADIARSLEITENTVITHVRHIYNKLDVHSRSQAVFEAANLGLIKVGQ